MIRSIVYLLKKMYLGFSWCANNKVLHLKTKGFPSDVRVRRQDPKQLLSEAWVPASELEGKGGENCLEITPVLVVSRTEETRAEYSIRKADLRKRLGNCWLPSSCETVEPENALVLLVV